MSRSVSGFAVAVLVLSLPFGGWAAWDRWYYLSDGQIANELPAYPGAKLTHQADDYRAYRLPSGTTRAAVQRFFAQRMPAGWERPDRECEGFTRRGALVIVGVDVFDERLLKLLIERKGAGDCSDYSWFLHS